MSTPSTAQQGESPQATPPAAQPTTSAGHQPAPSNRAARRGRGKGIHPATAADGYHGSAGRTGPARTTAQGRRINPVRRTG